MSRQWCTFRTLTVVLFTLVLTAAAWAQQTTGGITGVVTDPQGGILPGATVNAVGEETGLKRDQTSGSDGYYAFANLPVGHYTLTVTHDGFQTQVFPKISVEGGRTATLNIALAIGQVATSVTVNAVPLMNAVDTTNGYVLDKEQMESIPLPTGSFTGVAILSPGVNAELPSGTGANDGLGNLPIWANGQRDTSNSFSLNGVDGSSLFNGKSTSEVGSARVINSTGVSASTSSTGVIPSAASVYLSIGNAIPTPAPETVEEVRVNASMYDAQQGSTSGAHIDLATSSGTNDLHGTVYGHRGTNWINADPFFYKNDLSMPAYLKSPQLHRYIAGGTLGGPIIKDKLFGFAAYQHLHVSDQYLGNSFLDVPVGLSDTNRTAGGIANVVNANFPNASIRGDNLGGGDIDPTALALFQSPSVPGQPGAWLIPNDTESASLSPQHNYDAIIPGAATFIADSAVANLDWNATSTDTVALKYFYQHDPTVSPYSYSNVPGFTEHLDSGSQVAAINNTWLIKPNLSTTENIGILREKTWVDNEQPFGPSAIPYCASGQPHCGTTSTTSIDTFGSNYFPGVSIYNVLGEDYVPLFPGSNSILNIGPNAEGQAPNTGAFQNRLQPSADAVWTLGRHTVSFGTSYSYTQLNTIDKRTNTGTIATADLSAMAQGFVTTGSSATGFYVTSFLQGNANRYFRANQLGSYVQDKFQVTPTLSLTAGVRYDWDGGFSEKYGRIFNFDFSPQCSTPTAYCYTPSAGEQPGTLGSVPNGLVIAGNNANATKGVSNTTLTGRQWGIAPRVGAAWQPAMFKSKVVVRTGFGMYYDRGQLFSYFSPGYAIGTVTGGPYGANQSLPFVNDSSCTDGSLYEGYIPTCGGGGFAAGYPFTPVSLPFGSQQADDEGNLGHPYGGPMPEYTAPVSPKASDLGGYLPNLASIEDGGQPISLGVYDRRNKLPYTYNFTFDIQWQPRNDLAIELGYTGNLGRHQVIPVPFNQPGIASPTNNIHGETSSYGYNYDGAQWNDYEGGNVDHRVPYIGYAAESIDYKAAGIDSYNALTAHVDKRMSHGVQVGASYTYSHALDEQSGLGLFYNGNNPLNLRDGYASADFDRTHVITFNYVFRAPKLVSNEHSVEGYFADGWSLVGLTVLQSGQPYSVIDFSGAVGSIYYSTSDGITNPIVPLAPGCTPKNALTGHSGAFIGVNPDFTALKASCFTLPVLTAGPGGSFGGAIPAADSASGTGGTSYETGFTSRQRNIFRQSFQKRADASLVKMTNFNERYALKYTFDVYNLTNTTSFDVPFNEVSQNAAYNPYPNAGTPVLPGTCNAQGVGTVPGSFYSCPAGLGIVNHTIGSPRQIQMSLSLTFFSCRLQVVS